jgi:hypothetical protein
VAVLVTVFALLGPSAAARDPDLVIDQQALADFWYIEERYFPPDSCALVEECVGGPGVRKLLRFRSKTANISRVDLELGDPTGNPLFAFSPCHGHYHFEDYAGYRLKDLGGTVVAPKATGPGEIRGSAIEGGETRALAPGDVVVVPHGVPHWFREVQGPLTYYVVKVP